MLHIQMSRLRSHFTAIAHLLDAARKLASDVIQDTDAPVIGQLAQEFAQQRECVVLALARRDHVDDE